jgi:IclR family acetate operon transcriptional repressor
MPRDGQISSALGKVITVLETVIDRTGSVSIGALAMWLGLPKQTVHHIVRQLVDEGLLERAPGSDGYTAGQRLRRLSERTLELSLQTETVRAILQRLVGTLGETCNVGMLDGPEVVYLERVEFDWPLRMQLQPGNRVPAHCTGIGKMLLACLNSRSRRRLVESQPLKTYTKQTITDPNQLLDELKKIRRQGYALNDQENTTGMMGLAVPIHGHNGNAITGLAVHAPVARLAPTAATATLSQ